MIEKITDKRAAHRYFVYREEFIILGQDNEVSKKELEGYLSTMNKNDRDICRNIPDNKVSFTRSQLER